MGASGVSADSKTQAPDAATAVGVEQSPRVEAGGLVCRYLDADQHAVLLLVWVELDGNAPG
jgi:hypothetical protein